MLAKVIAIAALAHSGRKDKSGHPEILHPMRVGMKFYEMGEKDAVVYAGFLHDVVEDTNVLRCNTDA
jgi:GTP pyrophosphokinase